MGVSKLYLDMDGVLCSFENRYLELSGEDSAARVAAQTARAAVRSQAEALVRDDRTARLGLAGAASAAVCDDYRLAGAGAEICG